MNKNIFIRLLSHAEFSEAWLPVSGAQARELLKSYASDVAVQQRRPGGVWKDIDSKHKHAARDLYRAKAIE